MTLLTLFFFPRVFPPVFSKFLVWLAFFFWGFCFCLGFPFFFFLFLRGVFFFFVFFVWFGWFFLYLLCCFPTSVFLELEMFSSFFFSLPRSLPPSFVVSARLFCHQHSPRGLFFMFFPLAPRRSLKEALLAFLTGSLRTRKASPRRITIFPLSTSWVCFLFFATGTPRGNRQLRFFFFWVFLSLFRNLIQRHPE